MWQPSNNRSPENYPDRRLGNPVVRMGVVTSTMDVVRDLEALGAPEGVAVIAAAQTQGRGRADRSWASSVSTGLYCSMLLRPMTPFVQFEPFSIAVGLAICDAIDPDLRYGLQVKWPNDVLVDGKKLAGILITTNLISNSVVSAILGFGINLLPDSARPDHAIAVVEIAGIGGWSSGTLFDKISAQLTQRYNALLAGKTETALAGWGKRLAWLHEPVAIHDGDSTCSGFIRGLDVRGALLLETATGIVSIHSGELTRGPVLLDARLFAQ